MTRKAYRYIADHFTAVRYSNSYNPTSLEERSPELAAVFKAIEAGTFGDGHVYEPLLKTVSACDVSRLTTRSTTTTTTW